MDFLEAIFTRRSCRRFTGEVITDEKLNTLIRAGFAAPSAHNLQPWEFIVIRDPKSLEEIAAHHPYAKMAPTAGTCILVCGDHQKQEVLGFMVEDCSAAIQNILIAANGLGLGAVWCGIYPNEELVANLTKVTHLPANVIPIGLVVVGVKDSKLQPRDNYNESKVHFEKW